MSTVTLYWVAVGLKKTDKLCVFFMLSNISFATNVCMCVCIYAL